MSAVTPTWAIPFPTGQDRFCDGYLYTQQMAERVDTLLHTYEIDFDLLDNIPAAKTALTQAYFILNAVADPRVHWDAVEYDTAGLVSIVLDNTVIQYNRNGYWMIGSDNDYLSSPSTLNGKYIVGLRSTTNATPLIPSQATRDNGNNTAAKSAFGALDRFTNNNVVGLEGKISTQMTSSNAAVVLMIVASPGMTASWFREI